MMSLAQFFWLNLHKMPFSMEDKHTIKVLRQQKLYGARKILRMFPNKKWTLSRVKTVLSKIDATGSVERCSCSGRPCTARSPDTISHMAAEQLDLILNPIDYAVWGPGDPTRVCTTTTGLMDVEELRQRVEEEWDHLDQEVIDAISEWCKWLTACTAAGRGHFEHSLWTLLINMFWTLLTLLSFV